MNLAEEFGAAAARNEVLKLVTKEWVLVLDTDEQLNPAAMAEIDGAIAINILSEKLKLSKNIQSHTIEGDRSLTIGRY